MANTDDEHTKEKIRYNKNDYKKDLEAIFKESINYMEMACEHYDYEEGACAYYKNKQTEIRSLISERLGKLIADEKLIADDIHGSMITGRPTQILNPYLSANFLKYIERKMKKFDRAFQTLRRKYYR
jgi:hypothetical protein